jgi:hypothetical protein
MASFVWYSALNGTRKQENLGRDNWFRVPGSGRTCPIHVKRHCGGLLALRLDRDGVSEITEEALRDRLAETGLTLPWEEME